MGIGDKFAGVAKIIAGKIGKGTPKKEDLVLGAEAIPNGCRFDTGKQGAMITPEKKPTIVG